MLPVHFKLTGQPRAVARTLPLTSGVTACNLTHDTVLAAAAVSEWAGATRLAARRMAAAAVTNHGRITTPVTVTAVASAARAAEAARRCERTTDESIRVSSRGFAQSR
jgi:hypothetical protein